MSLKLAYNIARGALSTGGAAASVVSRNVANADNPDAARKSSVVATDATGATYLTGIAAQVSNAVLEQAMVSGAARSRHEVATSLIERLAAIVGDPELEGSPAAGIGDLRKVLQTAAGAPHDASALQAGVTAAKELASRLNASVEMVADVRTDAGARLSEGVAELKSLLADFGEENREIVSGTARGRDVTDASDRRNGLMRKISEFVEIRATMREGNDMMLHLASGVTLFETSAREIALDTTAPITTGQPGAPLRIDGVALPLDGSVGGRLGGLLVVRDDIAIKAGRQLDEIARGLIASTAESDQSALPSGPDQAGLFTYPGGPALPLAGVVVDGLASSIRVHANVDPEEGGIVDRLRDGGISNPADSRYTYNSTSAAGFSGRLIQLASSLSASHMFDAATGITSSTGGVLGFAADSAGWIEATRAASQDALETETVRAGSALGAWQSAVGVNLDDELAKLISLERSYQASSRLLTSVTGMFDALLSATR